MRRLRAKGELPFFAKSFARYSHAQKNYDKKKGKSREGVARPEERVAQPELEIAVLRERIRQLEESRSEEET